MSDKVRSYLYAMSDHRCKFCGSLFEKSTQLGAHVINCRSNPDYEAIMIKRIRTKTHTRHEHVFECKVCRQSFVLCISDSDFDRGNFRRHCSRKCANRRTMTEETRQKISMSCTLEENRWRLLLPKEERHQPKQKSVPEKFRNTCSVCQLVFESTRSPRVTCSSTCLRKHLSNVLKGRTDVGGYRTKSGTSKHHGSWYREVWMDSSWELAFAQRLDALQVEWERGTRTLPYVDESGTSRVYHPDFWLPQFGYFVEIKGYWLPKARHKISDAVTRNNVRLLVIESLQEICDFNPYNKTSVDVSPLSPTPIAP